MRITPAPGSLWRRVLPDGTVVTPRFSASGERDGIHIEMEVEIDELGHSRCLSFEATPVEDGGELRELPTMATLLREVTASSASWVSYSGPTSNGGTRFDPLTPQARLETYGRQHKRTPAVRTDSPYGLGDLERVAAIAQSAHRRGESVAQAVIDELHVSKATAGRRIKAARERGLLQA